MLLKMPEFHFTNKRRYAGATAIAAALFASVLAAPAAGFAQDAGKPVVIARDMDLNSLDPSRAFCDTCQIYLSSVYDRLVDLSPDNKSIVPLLAKEWSANADATVFTFKLDPNAKFSDGSPVEAKDVKWTLERLKNIIGMDSPRATVATTASTGESRRRASTNTDSSAAPPSTALRAWPTISESGLNTSAAMIAASSTRYRLKKYSSRRGIDSRRSMSEGGVKPWLP